MLTTLLWIGTIVGLVAGLVHAVHIISVQTRLPGADAVAMAWWRALWAVVLWTAFGGYLLLMWLLAAAPWRWRSQRHST